LSPLPVGD